MYNEKHLFMLTCTRVWYPWTWDTNTKAKMRYFINDCKEEKDILNTVFCMSKDLYIEACFGMFYIKKSKHTLCALLIYPKSQEFCFQNPLFFFSIYFSKVFIKCVLWQMLCYTGLILDKLIKWYNRDIMNRTEGFSV